MPMTEQDRAWHETYEQMDPEVKEITDRAVEAAQRHLRLVGLVTAQDDRAEQLVAAMARYVVLSNPHTSSLLINRLSPIAAAETVAITRAPETDANERHIRKLLTEVAVKHKDLFGTADTKQAIRKYGHALSLRDVPVACVPGLHRVLQGALDREAERQQRLENKENRSRRAGESVVPTRSAGKHPDLAAPYGREHVLSSPSPDPYTSFWPSPGSAATDLAPDEPTKVAGAGGSFDGGGASGSWDTTPSSSDPSPTPGD